MQKEKWRLRKRKSIVSQTNQQFRRINRIFQRQRIEKLINKTWKTGTRRLDNRERTAIEDSG